MPKFLKDIDLAGNNLNNALNIYTKTAADALLLAKVSTTVTVNGHALSGNISVTKADVGLTSVEDYSRAQILAAPTITGAATFTGTVSGITPTMITLGNVTNDAQVKRIEMGAVNGVATLDGTGKLTTSQIPTSLVGAIAYQGVWNATTNVTPTLANGVGVKGQYYKVSVAGNTVIDGNTNWTAGDLIIYNGTTWDKVEGGSPDVVSVAGRVGAVVLTTADVASSADKRYVTDAQSTVIGNTTNTNSGDETLATIKTKLGIATLSGANTGDQTITLTGDVTGTGTGSFVTSISPGAVTLADQANIPANTIIGNNTAGPLAPIALTPTQVKTLLAVAIADVSGLTADLTTRAVLGANAFTGKQSMPTSVAGAASLNIPQAGANPTTPLTGDFWGNAALLKWHNGTTTKILAFTDGNITGNSANVTGVVAIANGGTGQTAAQPALAALGGVGKYSAFVGTTAADVLTHGLGAVPATGTTDVQVFVYEVATKLQAFPDIEITSATTVTIKFSTIPGAGTYRVVIVG